MFLLVFICRALKCDRLQGPGVEIRVGVSTPQHEETGTYNNWCLPQNLTSHFSPFLKAACLRSFKERHECRIELPEDDARVFTLFVQWMYYGEYHIPTLSEEASKSFFCIHARCWILGDKLLCTKFKNYAMSRIYGQHTTSFAPTPVTIQDVDYVCKNSVLHSKLRTFYFAFVIEHFADQDRLLGTTEEWDKLLLVHADVRLLMVQSFRMPPEEQMYVEDEEYYLDQDDILATSFEKTNIGDDILEQTRDVRTKN